MLDLQVGCFVNIRGWPENSQNYYEYSPILIRNIFHHNTRVVENPSAFQDEWTMSGHLHGSSL